MERHESNVLPVGHLIDPEELHDPIEFLRIQHEDQRTFCRRLNALVDDLGRDESAAEATSLLEFLFGEMPLNMVAEEKTLVPLLCDRCGREDLLTAVVNDTWKAHTLIALLLPEVGTGLRCLSDGQVPGKPLDFIFNSLEFVSYVERHVDREDLTLLPLARFRLTTEDYVWLGQTLARQRGLPYPSGWEPEDNRTGENANGPGRSSETPAVAASNDGPGLRIGESRTRTNWRHRKATLFGRLH